LSRFAVAYSCSFVRLEPLERPDLALLVAREAVLLAREPPLRAVVFARAELPPLALFARELAVFARELAVLPVFRAPLAAFLVLLAAFRVPLAAAFRVPLAAFRVPLAAFRVVRAALAVPLLAAFFARAVPLLEDARVAFVPDLLERDLLEPDAPVEPERARLPDVRRAPAEARVPPELREPSPSPCSLCSLCSSPWLISFFATLTAAGTATPKAAPATTFFVVDIPSSSASISHTSHVVAGSRHLSRALLNDSMKRGTMRSVTMSGAFWATNLPSAPAASSAAGPSASRAASQPPDAIEPNMVPPWRLLLEPPPFCERWPFELPPSPESAFRAMIAAAPAAAAAAAAAFRPEPPPLCVAFSVVSSICSDNALSLV
jgi:hypothetical protein